MSGAPTPPGWYPDPSGGGGQRYWDGSAWTDERQGAPPAPPAPTVYVQQESSNGMAVAALVLGILAVVLCWIPFVAQVLAVLAIIFGALSRNRALKDPAAGRKGMAVAGLVLGIVGLVVSIVILVLVVENGSVCIGSYNDC